METKKELLPTEELNLNLIKGLVLHRRMREHGTRSEQYLVQVPADLLDQTQDVNTQKRFKLQFGYTQEGKRVIVLFLDEFIFPNQHVGGVNNGRK